MAVNGPTTAEEVEPSYATFPRAQEKNTDQHHFLTVPRKSHSHNHVAKKLVRSHSASAMRIHSNKTPVNQRRNIAAAGASGVTSIPVVTPKSHRKEPAGVPVMLLNGEYDKMCSCLSRFDCGLFPEKSVVSQKHTETLFENVCRSHVVVNCRRGGRCRGRGGRGRHAADAQGRGAPARLQRARRL